MTLTETSIRLEFTVGFSHAVINAVNGAVPPRDIPLSTIDKIHFDARLGWDFGAIRLRLEGEPAPAGGAIWDTNSMMVSNQVKDYAANRAFVSAAAAAIALAAITNPMGPQLAGEAVLQVAIPGARYRGALSSEPPQLDTSSLFLTSVGIGTGTVQPQRGFVRWADCVGISIDGDQIAASRLLGTVMLGAPGLEMDTTERVLVTAYKADGSAAVYELEHRQAEEVQATISPLLRVLNIPIRGDEVVVVAPPADSSAIMELLRQLGALRDAGVLTSEEFLATKTEMLSRL